MGNINVNTRTSKLIDLQVLNDNLLLITNKGMENFDLLTWVKNNNEVLQSKLIEYGAILFRDLGVSSIDKFGDFTKCISPSLLSYNERSTPRTEVQNNIYTSTEYPPDQYIPMHNENSYQSAWPMKIWFYCNTVSEKGGETPIADSRKVYNLLDPQIKERFEKKKVMYVRNYGNYLDIAWQTAFQTTQKSDVENYCRKANIHFEWKDEDRLKTYSLRPAYASHPITKQNVWFNQAHLFHITSLPSEVSEWLVNNVAQDDLPRNTYYGDGSPIEKSVIEEINSIYKEVSISFPWQEGDVLMLDNMLTAHGRFPFIGKRKVVVAMAEPLSKYGFD